MVFSDGLEHLDKLLQRSLSYKHHQLNYEESLRRGVVMLCGIYLPLVVYNFVMIVQ